MLKGYKVVKLPAAKDGPIILESGNPIATARQLVADRFLIDGQRILQRHRGSLWRYSEQRGCYEMVDDDTMKATIWTFLEAALRPAGKGKYEPFRPTRAKVGEVFEALGAVCDLDASVNPPVWLGDAAQELPPASDFVVCTNGLLHLPTSKLFQPTPLYFTLSASDVVFDPDSAPPVKWLAFLDQLFGDDAQAAAVLQDWFGYSISADTSQQKVFMLIGPRRCGKGTIGRVLTPVVGRESVVAPTLASLATNFGLEPLIGKPLAIISDARLGIRSDQAAIAERLLAISGEDGLTIDRKYKSAWTGRMPTRFMLLTNELPSLKDASGALAGRFVILILTQSFYGREDPALTNKLLEELPGIFNWALVGYQRLRQRGYFVQADSVSQAVEDLEMLASPVKAFVREKCDIGPGLQVTLPLLYGEWVTWCANNNRKPGTREVFGRDLSAAMPFLTKRRPRTDDDRVVTYEGVALRSALA